MIHQHEHGRSDERRRRVQACFAAEHDRDFIGQHVPEDAAHDAGDHAHDDRGGRGNLERDRLLGARHRETGQHDGVGDQQRGGRQVAIAQQVKSDDRGEGRVDHKPRLFGPEHRHVAQRQIPDRAAAKGRDEASTTTPNRSTCLPRAASTPVTAATATPK